MAENNSGFNKWDWITAGIGLAGLVLGLAGIYTGNKATNTRIDQQNARLNPGIRQPNPPQV